MKEKQNSRSGESDTASLNVVILARQKLGLTQAAFAQLLETPLGTVRGWEQGRRQPPSCANFLMRIAMEAPEAVLRVSGLVEQVQPPKCKTSKAEPTKSANRLDQARSDDPTTAQLHEPGADADYWLL
ncbi:MAG: helix-turn-helix domain-containing protein [Puniceicoccaceae bacterium]|nr:MAG: helix-turn-helix domain-containing protein [Puniceicoccaceae bacterium]